MNDRGRVPLAFSVQVATRCRGLPGVAQFGRWARAALAHPAAVTLRLVGEREGAQLNRRYRRRAGATNVLAFAYGEHAGRIEGDIVLCAPVVRREARAGGKALPAHYAHLVVHGMLHLQGYDHAGEREARRMQARETAILRRLGLPDPYRAGPEAA